MELETRRNLFHMAAGLIFVVLLYYDIINSFSLFALLISALILSYLSLRIRIPVLYWFLEKLDRKEDLKKFPGKGSILFVLGMLIASLFPKDIALAGIVILSLGDSMNTIVGVRGRVRNPFNNKRFIEGFFAGFAAAFIGALFFVSVLEAFTASFIAMVFECVDMRFRINDNVMIPFVACVSIWMLRLMLG